MCEFCIAKATHSRAGFRLCCDCTVVYDDTRGKMSRHRGCKPQDFYSYKTLAKAELH